MSNIASNDPRKSKPIKEHSDIHDFEDENFQDPKKNDSLRPRFCVWETTLACNLRCKHCGSRAGKRRPGELTNQQALRVVSQLADLGCRLVSLSGGEPLLRKDWAELAREGTRRGMTMNMVSNGTLITQDKALKIRDVGLSNVGISVDGLPSTHEALRGSGTFKKLRNGVIHLVNAGVPVTIMTTLDRFNEPELEDLHTLAVNMGASAWRIQLGKTMGSMADNSHRSIHPEDLLDVLPRLSRIKQKSPIWVDVGDSIGYYGPHEHTLRESRWGNMQNLWRGCQAGLRTIGIESDGGVKACLSLQGTLKGHKGDPFREGDLRTHSLEEIWFDPHVFSFNRRFDPKTLTGFCAQCRYASLCRGGAKCVASAFTQTLGEDPYCYHRVSMLQAQSRKEKGSFSRLATAAALAMGMGLSGACLGGCLDRSLGIDEQNPPPSSTVGVDAGEADAENLEPPLRPDYGVMPEPDAQVDDDAEPPYQLDYGVFPEPELLDAQVDEDAEPPYQDDYGVMPPDPIPQDAGVGGDDE